MEDGIGGLQIWNTAISSWQDVRPVKGIRYPTYFISVTIIEIRVRSVCGKSWRHDIEVDARHLQNNAAPGNQYFGEG